MFVTYNSQSKAKCTSIGVFRLLKCTLEGTMIAHLSATGLKHTQGAKLSGEFLSFSRPNAEVAVQWTGRYGPTIDVDAASTSCRIGHPVRHPFRRWAAPKRNCPLLPLARGVGGYNHHCIGDEVEWTPPLLYTNPLGHRVPATPDM